MIQGSTRLIFLSSLVWLTAFSPQPQQGITVASIPQAIAAESTPGTKTKTKTKTKSSPISTAPSLSPLESQIVAETNRVRANPRSYIVLLEAWKGLFQGNQVNLGINVLGNTVLLATQEGVGAVDEAIRFLKVARPVAALTPSKGMSLAAKDHAKDQGKTGAIGHSGSDGSDFGKRLNRHGIWQKTIGESVSYGSDNTQQIVLQLIIDDGVRDRGHRTNIFSPDWQLTGVGCGPHPKYQTVCVVDYAGGYREK